MDSSTKVLPTLPSQPPASSAVAEAAAKSAATLRYAGIVAAVLVVVGALVGLVPRWQHRQALRAQTHELAMQTVSVVCPAPSSAAPGLSMPAEIKPLVEAPILARTSGYLKRWLVDLGAQVKPGELLAEIDAPERSQELAQARAELKQAEAALALAKITTDRWSELIKTASVSEQEAAEKHADFDLKAATVEASRANVRRLEQLQSFSKVLAPFAGTITARNTDVGELISAGSGKELFRLAQTATLRVYVRVPQSVARSIVPGQIAELTIPELPARPFPAKVVRSAGVMSADSRTLLVELEVDNSRGEILAGTYAQIRFPDARPEPLLTLPANALLFRSEGPQVGVVNAGGKVELHNVALGRDFGPTVEILSGINQTDRVILNPSDSLVSGITVRVVTGQP